MEEVREVTKVDRIGKKDHTPHHTPVILAIVLSIYFGK